jgi:hypothetical protein
VPAKATQAGEIPDDRERRSLWPWVEASIWTDRMLAALETGVKGGCWFSLIDKVYSPKNLWSAWTKSAKNNGAAGVDGITIDRYEKDAEANVAYLSEQMKAGTYQPKPIRLRTPRNSGVSLEVTIKRINPTLRGWFGYFKHASGGLHTVDGWVRERLRNILRHQHKLPGRSGKMDHKRWPNKFFAGLGFYSLDKAHKLARQSMKMAH